MFFWFKKNKVVLECFTTNEVAYEYAKVDRMIKFFPDWWKKTKVSCEHDNTNYPTIKKCVGILEFYKKSITIPLWAKLKLSFNRDGFGWESSGNVEVASHPREQFSYFAQSDGYNLKIVSPWLFRTKKLKFFSWSNPIYNNRNHINLMTFLPGVVEFKYNHVTSINYFVTASELNEEKIIYMEPFTPLATIIPMFEEEIIIKNIMVDEKEISKINYHKFFMFNRVDNLNLYSEKKKIINQVEARCPFNTK